MIAALAGHLGQSANTGLANFLAHTSFTEVVSLDDLFDLAVVLDDGHGLENYQMEGAMHALRPSLGRFGGDASFRSRQFKGWTDPCFPPRKPIRSGLG